MVLQNMLVKWILELQENNTVWTGVLLDLTMYGIKIFGIKKCIGNWMYQYLNKQEMTIFGDGNQTRAFSFIDDSLEPIEFCS